MALLASIALFGSLALAQPETGSIAGRVLDEGGAGVGGVCVVVCDSASGLPIDGQTGRPMGADAGDLEHTFERLVFAVTSNEGAYTLTDLAPGGYRLIAQSWRGSPSPDGLLEVNGGDVHLRGVSGPIELDAGEIERSMLRPLGSCTLAIDVDAGNDESLIVLSTSPTRADPILGFAGWRGPFMTSMLGFNRAPDGRTVFRGLPEGEAHIATFSADNVPGWGAASVTLREDRPVEVLIPFVVPWSDGQHLPPPELEAITEQIGTLDPEARGRLTAEIITRADINMDAAQSNPLAALARVGRILDEQITLDDGSGHRCADVLAALGYIGIRDSLARSGRTPNPYRTPTVRPFDTGPSP